jgi:hypothetical protein
VKPSESGEQQAEVRLAEAFASFLKTTFVYPENNVRVRDALRASIALIHDLRFGEEPVTLKVSGSRVMSVNVPLEPPLSPMVAWMKAAFEKTALAGIEFGQTCTEDHLLEFARRLRANFTQPRTELSFQSLWAEPIDGMRLVEPRFRGRFSAKSKQQAADEFPDAPATQTVRFGESLRKHPGIAKKLMDLQQTLHEQQGGTAEVREADIVAHVVHLLPEEIRNNPVALIKTVETILLHATDELRARNLDSSDEERGFRQLLLRICRTFFVREDDRAEAAPPRADQPAKGHPGDQLITDDLQAFLREVEALPAPARSLTLVDSPAEQLGVCLHQLMTTDDEDHLNHIKPRLVDLCAAPTEEQLAVVRQCITAAVDGPAVGRSGIQRLLSFLREGKYTSILRSSLVLPPESVIAAFPVHFTLFLDSLDEADPESLQKLATVAGAVGRSRFLQKAGALIADGLLAEDRVAKIVARPSRELLPLAEIALQHGDRSMRAPFVQFLRKLDPETPAAAALCIDEARLTGPFLIALCQSAGGSDQPATTRTAANLLKDFIAERASDQGTIGRQVYAVHALRRVWSAEVARFVRTLSRRQWFGGGVAKPIREAARELLERMPVPRESAT